MILLIIGLVLGFLLRSLLLSSSPSSSSSTLSLSPALTCRCGENRYPVVVQRSGISGRGVFATRKILPRQIVEVCPAILDEDENFPGELRHYRFRVNRIDSCLPLGYGSLVNHSDQPNCRWEYDPDLQALVITALREIQLGEEITHSYGERYWSSRPGAQKKELDQLKNEN